MKRIRGKGNEGKYHVELLGARHFSSFTSFNPNENFTLWGTHHYFHFTNKDSDTREVVISRVINLDRTGDRFQVHIALTLSSCSSFLATLVKYFWKDSSIAYIIHLHPIQKFTLPVYFSNYLYTVFLILLIKYMSIFLQVFPLSYLIFPICFLSLFFSFLCAISSLLFLILSFTKAVVRKGEREQNKCQVAWVKKESTVWYSGSDGLTSRMAHVSRPMPFIDVLSDLAQVLRSWQVPPFVLIMCLNPTHLREFSGARFKREEGDDKEGDPAKVLRRDICGAPIKLGGGKTPDP